MLKLQITRASLVDSVAQQIKKMMLNGKLKPGDSLPSQRKFAVQLGVGTPTIREALKGLASIGLIRIEHGRSTIVRAVNVETLISGVSSVVELTQADVISIFEAEDIIETRCAEIAAERITKEELSLMAGLLETMQKYRNNRKKYSAADYEFHATIVNAARNPIIGELMKIVRRMELRAIERTVLDTGLTRRDLAMRYHHQIYEAIRDGDSARASALTHEHLRETITRYSRTMKARGNGRPQ